MPEKEKLTGYPSIDKPWLKYYSEEAINAPLPECTIYEYLMENNRDYPDDIALLYLGRKIKYGELFRQIDRTADAFSALGVKPGEIVTVALPSIPEALYCVYALNKIGAVANMIHPLAGKDETFFYFNEVKSRIAVIYDGAYAVIADDIGKSAVEKVIVASPADSLPITLKAAYKLKVKAPHLDKRIFIRWKDFIRFGRGTAVLAVKKDCLETAIISHTGGTTGEPKGVMCTDLGCNSLMWQLLCNFHFDRQERSLNVLPPFVNYSLLESIMAMLAEGITAVLIPKYDPMAFDKYLKKYRPNQILSIPAYWEAVLRIPNIERADMSCLKHLYAGGEAMASDVKEAIDSLIMSCGAKTKLYVGLGSTEMIAGATITYDSCYVPGSVGIPMVRVNCKIVDQQSGCELSYFEEGEICFSGETMMLGYYNNTEATDEVIRIHADGRRWLHTGDLGYIDENGALYVTGRIKRILMTKGKDGNITKIFPDRIEKAIYQHPAVELCCVVGIPDEERINYPKAFVVTKAGVIKDNALTNELLRLCQDKLPGYMVPDEIEYCDDLPRTPRGKIDYRALEEMAKEM